MQRGMDVLLDPAKVNALIRQPAIRGLKNRADVSEALKQLNEDPDIKRLLDSDNPASKDLAIHLCNHPAVLQLLDKPEFRSEAMGRNPHHYHASGQTIVRRHCRVALMPGISIWPGTSA